METKSYPARKWIIIISGILILFGLYLTTLYNYLLFHSIAELFIIVVACGIFIIAWNSRRFLDNNYLLFIGIAYLFIAVLELIHTLGYTGMGIFKGYDTDLPARFWIAARYMESLSFLIAPLFFGRRIRLNVLFIAYASATCLILLSIFLWNIFPTCFVEGTGLTPFKKISEYIISLIFIGSIALLFRNRKEFDVSVYRLLVASIIIAIASELAFTFYIHAYGFSNLIGHYFKIISFYLIYKAIIETGILKPYDLLFRNLKKSEAELRLQGEIASNLSEGVYLIRVRDFAIVYTNPSFEKIFGYGPGEMVGKHVSIVNAPTEMTPEETIDHIVGILKETGKWKGEIKNIKKDGTSFWCYASASLFEHPEHGEIIISVHSDIDERKQVDEALLKSEATLRSIFKAAPTGIGLVSDRVIKEINDKFCEIVGYSREELLGKNARLLYPTDEDYEYVGKIKYEQIDEAGTGTVETRLKRKDGKVINVLVSSTPLNPDDLSQGVTFTALDITWRKKVEHELRESEEKYRSMMESMKDSVAICSADYRVKYMNPAMIKRIGRDGTGEVCFKAFHGLDEKCSWCRHYEMQQGKCFESDIVSPMDNRSYQVSHSPIFHQDGSISKMIIFRDTTDLKKMETQLQQAQKMEAIGTLAGGIAHDFNNILSPIMIHSEMAMMELPPDSPVQNSLKQILQAGERARDLTKQILTFSRMRQQERSHLKVGLIVKECLKMLRASLPTTIEINQNLESESDTVLCDITEINQILMNLCTNSAHAMRDKGGELTINLTEEHLDPDAAGKFPDLNPGSYLKLTVSDTGHGIDNETMKNIFEPYFTTKGPGEGTGMGLAVVHGIVRSYGGDITVESEPGKGTSFHVLLPTIESEASSPIEPSVKLPKGTERILFVDDEKVAVDVMQAMLEKLGYKVTARTSSIEALEAFRHKAEAFDLVITDMTMPNMTGDELAKELMSIRADIPIILCTGFSEKMDEKKAMHMGISAFVMKPIVMREIANTIREVLDKK